MLKKPVKFEKAAKEPKRERKKQAEEANTNAVKVSEALK